MDGWMWIMCHLEQCEGLVQNVHKKITHTCNKQRQLCWMWLQNMLFCMCERCYLPKCYCWRDRMVRFGKTTCVTTHRAIFLTWMVKLTHHWQLFLPDHVVCCVDNLQGLSLCWFVIDFPKVGIWDFLCHDWKKYWLKNSFTFNALSKPRYLFM